MSYTSLAAEFDAALERISETYRAVDAFADDDDSLPARSAREAYSRAKLIYRSVELRLRAAHLRRSSAPKRLLIYASESQLGDSLAALTSAWGFASVLVASLDDARGVGTIDADIAVVAYIEPTRSGEHIWRSLKKSLPGHPIVLVASRLPTVTHRLPADTPFQQAGVKLLSVSSLRAELKFLQSMPRRSPKPGKASERPACSDSNMEHEACMVQRDSGDAVSDSGAGDSAHASV
ncbi:MAG: hypothetical protein V4793_19690 [Paraburkholderia tropica]|uniref:hypothetical protein n=1 Tax=Paraburkholderia tropica TaxID=92647 RepID=UPI0031012119